MKSDGSRKLLKVDEKPGRIVNSMQMEMSLSKAPCRGCIKGSRAAAGTVLMDAPEFKSVEGLVAQQLRTSLNGIP